MLKRLMLCLMALLVALAFGALPTLALASDATASPPLLFDRAPEVAQVACQANINGSLHAVQERASPAALEDYNDESPRPTYPLLN